MSVITRLVRAFSSLKITVLCLLLLCVLTVFGTLYQADWGLYAAQHKVFYSWLFLIYGPVPFPGVRLVLWVLFVNLLAAFVLRFRRDWAQSGMWLIHGGLLLMFVSAFLTFHGAQEMHLTLKEGQGSNVAASYFDWEVALWRELGPVRDVYAQDVSLDSLNTTLSFLNGQVRLDILDYERNCLAYRKHPQGENAPVVRSASGIVYLQAQPFQKEWEKNIPGLRASLQVGSTEEQVILYGTETEALSVEVEGVVYALKLRQKRSVLPFTMILKDVVKDVHPGTNIPKTYQSLLRVESDTMSKDVVISMNKPFRSGSLTFYQASYAMLSDGREMSTLATVANRARMLPYVSSLMVVFGLILHFMIRYVGFRRRSA